MASQFMRNLEEHKALFATLHELDASVITAAQRLTASLRAGCKLLFCGNGGSAADSQHLAAELTGRLAQDRRPLAAVSLASNIAVISCIANDYAFDQVFARQVHALGREGDCLIALSTSGNSANVLLAAKAARGLGVHVVGLLGRDGGQMLGLCDLAIVVPGRDAARIQEAHMLIGHTLCELVEIELGLTT